MGIEFLLNQKTKHDKQYRKGLYMLSGQDAQPDLFRRKISDIKKTFVANIRNSAKVAKDDLLIATKIGKRVALSKDGRLLAECIDQGVLATFADNMPDVSCVRVENVNVLSDTVDLSWVVGND